MTQRPVIRRRRVGTAALALVLVRSTATSRPAEEGAAPTGLVTKVDIIARRDSLEGGIGLDSFTLKYDRGLDER